MECWLNLVRTEAFLKKALVLGYDNRRKVSTVSLVKNQTQRSRKKINVSTSQLENPATADQNQKKKAKKLSKFLRTSTHAMTVFQVKRWKWESPCMSYPSAHSPKLKWYQEKLYQIQNFLFFKRFPLILTNSKKHCIQFLLSVLILKSNPKNSYKCVKHSFFI